MFYFDIFSAFHLIKTKIVKHFIGFAFEDSFLKTWLRSKAGLPLPRSGILAPQFSTATQKRTDKSQQVHKVSHSIRKEEQRNNRIRDK